MTLLDHKKLGELIQECRSGNEQAFQQFYEHTAQVQYYQIRQMVKNPSDAMDALQETYLLLYKNINNIKNTNTIIAYLNTLSYHVCQNHFRVTSRRERRISGLETMEEIPDHSDDPQEVLLRVDKSSQICEAILSLSAEERLVLSMRYMQKLTLRETAVSMKLSYAKVRRLQQSAKKHLREKLELKGIFALFPILPTAGRNLLKMLEKQISLPIFTPNADKVSRISVPSEPAASFSSLLAKGAIAVTVSGAIVCGTVALITSPPEISAVHKPELYTGASTAVIVDTDSKLPLALCIMKNKGEEFPGKSVTGGQYSFNISKNGDYTLILKNTAGKTASKKIRIDCFDEIYPTAKSVRLKGKTFIVKFHDGESGIDEQSIYYDTSSGEKIYPKSFDRQTMTAVFRAVKGSHTLHFSDRSGNKSSALLKF